MVTMDVIKMSSKGQIVIPFAMRADLKEGEVFVIIKDDERFILKKVEILAESLREDLEFAKRTEEAWKSYDRGEFISQTADEFLEELDRC